MTIMKIYSSECKSKVNVKITNVSVKHYSYTDNIADELYSRFKYENPTKLIMDKSTPYVSIFELKLLGEGIIINEDGIVNYKKEVDDIGRPYIKLEESSMYSITVNSGHDQYKMYEILLSNGYIISSKVEKDKVHISIHGKN